MFLSAFENVSNPTRWKSFLARVPWHSLTVECLTGQEVLDSKGWPTSHNQAVIMSACWKGLQLPHIVLQGYFLQQGVTVMSLPEKMTHSPRLCWVLAINFLYQPTLKHIHISIIVLHSRETSQYWTWAVQGSNYPLRAPKSMQDKCLLQLSLTNLLRLAQEPLHAWT